LRGAWGDGVALNVIMMGPPGAGKGTQAERFARERGLLKISTGDILRESIKAQMPMALRAKELMDRGELVDDATMIAIVRDRLMWPDAQPGFVLDGFPRTVAQAEALDRFVAERDNGPLVIVDVRVPEHELVSRLAGRLICAKCGANAEPSKDGSPAPTACERCGGELVQRADDNEQVVLERLKVYDRATKPLVEFYRDRPTFRIVNGAQPQERVAHEMDTVIDDAASVDAKQATPAAVKAATPGKAARA
jgi:adenylate kinase